MQKYFTLYVILFVLAAAFVIFEGCSEDKTEAPAPDTTAPTVLASEPANNAVDVSRSGPFWVLFSEAMNEESVENNLSFLTAGSISVGFDTYWIGDSLFVSPNSFLDGGSDYIITVSESSKDLAENQLGNDYVINFTTTSDNDNIPPTVISTIPADGATDVTPVITIEITFSEPINIPSFDWDTQTFFTIDPPLSDGDISINGPTLMLEDLVFPQATEVEITFNTDITDLAGNPMAADYTLSFETATDNVRPTLVSAVPSNGATGVSPELTQLVLNFSESMNPNIPMTPENIDARIENSVPTDPNWNLDMTSITVLLTGSSLSPGCTYWANFSAMDMAGNPIDPNPTPYVFTTSGTASYFPVAEGNIWGFLNTDTSDYEINSISNYNQSNGTFEIVFKYSDGGAPVTGEIWYLKKTSSEIQFLGRDEYENGTFEESWMWDSPLTLFKLPIIDHLDETWSLSTTFTVGTTTASLNGTVTIDAALTDMTFTDDGIEGTFKSCVKHTLSVLITSGSDSMEHSQQNWLAPGVGWIKQISQDSPSDIDTLVVEGWEF